MIFEYSLLNVFIISYRIRHDGGKKIHKCYFDCNQILRLEVILMTSTNTLNKNFSSLRNLISTCI